MLRYVTQRAQLIRAYYAGIGRTMVIYPAAFMVALALGHVLLGIVLYARQAFDAVEAVDRLTIVQITSESIYRIGRIADNAAALEDLHCLADLARIGAALTNVN